MSLHVPAEPHTAERRSASPGMPTTAPGGEASSGTWWKVALLAAAVLGVTAAAAFPLIHGVTPRSDTQVLTHAITRGDLVVSVTEQGTLESSSNKEIRCKVRGTSTVLWVIETGTEVKPGDVLVRLDTSTIEDNISQQKIIYENALANKTTSDSDVAVAKIAVTEYLEGTFRSEMATKQKELVIAESNLKTAKNAQDHAQNMFRKGYINALQLNAQEDAVRHAELEVEGKTIDLEVLEKFTKAKTLEELQSALAVAEARLASDTAALDLEKARLVREEQQLENCVICADVAGLVIYPSAAAWKEQPDIEEGAVVREDQVLLMIPDLSQMQVKVGIHESKVDRLRIGMPARIEVQEGYLRGEVFSVASITKPAGWWTGNLVKYDTVIKLDENQPGLKPGMSVAVEVFLARYEDVLTVPVAAVVEQEEDLVCWVKTDDGIVKRSLTLRDSNDQFIVVERGLEEGERVVLNPLDLVDEAQRNALKPVEDAEPKEGDEVQGDSGGPRPRGGNPKRAERGPQAKPNKQTVKISGAAIIKRADKNGDGVLTSDEVDERSRAEFETNDANGDGKLDAAEIDAVIKRKVQAASGQ